MADWFVQNWFTILSALAMISGIVGLFLTVDSIRSETKTRRISNLLTITQNHREIWRLPIEHPELNRVMNPSPDLAKNPVTRQEEIFVTVVVLHVSSVYYAMKDELLIKLEGLRRDVASFFSLPIPGKIWEKIKLVQNDDFIAFVEQCRNWK